MFRREQRPSGAAAVDDPVRLYLKEIGQMPLLTAKEEVALAERIEAGQIAQEELSRDSCTFKEQAELEKVVHNGLVAHQHLVHANSRLVVSLAKRYVDCGLPFLDLIQEGNIGLMRAAKKFNYRRGIKFSAYARWWIRQAVTRAIANQSHTIRVPAHIMDQISKLLRTSHHLAQELGREPTLEELAAVLEIPTRRAKKVLEATHPFMSLEMPIGDEEGIPLSDFITDEDSPTPDEAVISLALQEVLQEVLQDLPPRTARVLQLRYGLVDGEMYSLKAVGEKLGVTYERVRQIEVQGLHRLRHPARVRRLRDFL
ncbi:MAG: sigma-70 family RNA polymerase sigma factor [Chloroflexi bacterium]|nr:sigma-70 family RNA polymerase sigma factor [Chloroflexota bacterium]